MSEITVFANFDQAQNIIIQFSLIETIGNVNEETITKYTEEQYERDRLEGEPSQGKQSRF